MTGTDLALTVGWAVLVLALAVRHRPRAGAVAARSASAPGPPARRRSDPLAAIGFRARRLAGGRSGGASDRAVGSSVILGLVGLVVWAPFGALAGGVVWLAVVARARRRPDALARALTSDLVEAVELLSVALAGGLSTRAALEEVCPWLEGPLRDELVRCLDRADLGWPLADELDRLPSRLHSCTRSFSTVLVSAERYGAPIVPALERLGEDLRLARRRQLEEAARRAPVKLLFPLIGGILPAFVLLAVVPLVVGALAGIRGGP